MALGLNAFCAGWELWGCGKERKKECGCFISLCRHPPLWCRKEQQNSDHHTESSPCPRTPLLTAQDPVSHYQASHLSSLGTSLRLLSLGYAPLHEVKPEATKAENAGPSYHSLLCICKSSRPRFPSSITPMPDFEPEAAIQSTRSPHRSILVSMG